MLNKMNTPVHDQGHDKVSATCKVDTPASHQPLCAEADPACPDVTVINIPPRPPPGFYEPEYSDALFISPEEQIHENTLSGVHSVLLAIPRGSKPMKRVRLHDADECAY